MDDPIWHLQKHDGQEVYGPVGIDNLRHWATAAKISPLDRISSDNRKTWERAPMIPDLHMDWLVEVNEDFLYGPTTIGAIQEFLSNGEIDGNTLVINCRHNTNTTIKDSPVFTNTPQKSVGPSSLSTPAVEPATSVSGEITKNLQTRVRELELKLVEQKRYYEMLEKQYNDLRDMYVKATGSEPYK